MSLYRNTHAVKRLPVQFPGIDFGLFSSHLQKGFGVKMSRCVWLFLTTLEGCAVFVCHLPAIFRTFKDVCAENTNAYLNKYECTTDQELACSLTRWQQFSAWNDVIAAILKFWRHIGNPTPMRIYLKNILEKFYPDQIGNDGALGFFKEVAPTRTRTRWVAIWDQLVIRKKTISWHCWRYTVVSQRSLHMILVNKPQGPINKTCRVQLSLLTVF